VVTVVRNIDTTNAKGQTMNTTKHKKNAGEEWLTAKMRNGRRRIEVLGWRRLAAIYASARPGSATRKAINAEARRCGYTPHVILAINAE
jgi:hypothetical protein